jgi:hypothetical protein
VNIELKVTLEKFLTGALFLAENAVQLSAMYSMVWIFTHLDSSM